MERKKITFDSFIRGVILGVIIIGILMLFKRLSGVLLPFFIAWLIAYLIYPLVTFFQYRLRLKSRVISIFCALFSILIVGGTAFYLLVPPMMDEFVRVKDLVIDYFSNGTHDGNVPKTLSEFLRENIDTQFVTQLFKEENMLNAIKETVPRLWSLLSESVNLLFSFFTFFLILLYIVSYCWITKALPKDGPTWYRKIPAFRSQCDERCKRRHEQVLPRTSVRGIVCRYSVQYRFSDY